MGNPDLRSAMTLFAPDSTFMRSCAGCDGNIDAETKQADCRTCNQPNRRSGVCTSALTNSTARAQAEIFDAAYVTGVGKFISVETVAKVFGEEVSCQDIGLPIPLTTFTQVRVVMIYIHTAGATA